MERKRSSKKVLSLEETTHPFECVFIQGNCPGGVFISVNGEPATFPLHKLVTLQKPHFFALKAVNKIRKLYDVKEHDYDPFTDPAYL